MLKTFRAAIAAWADAHLVPEWRRLHKLWSIRLAAIAGLIAAYFGDADNCASWIATLYGLPPPVRAIVPPGLFILAAFTPAIIRLWNQKKGG